MSDEVASGKRTRWRAWLRVCLPLLLWSALALVLAGAQLHRHLLQSTRLHGSVSFEIKEQEQPFEVLLDGNPFYFGERVSLGHHTLSVTAPKAVRFQTNLYSWYGKHDLGKITLSRSMGILAITASPPASRVIVRGEEFSNVLTNSAGLTSSVPTGEYAVEGIYKYWRYEDTMTIAADQTTARKVLPRFGSLAISGSHPGIWFKLWNNERRLIEVGPLPTTLNGLPAGDGYRLDAERNGDTQSQQLSVKEWETNAVDVVFTYGSLMIDSSPTGATVIKSGRGLGTTPLHLHEVKPGPFEFSLRLNEYESVSGTMTVVANETNGYRTNLISQQYTRAMTAARALLANGDYERAANAATEALAHKADDTEALALRRNATCKGHITKGEGFATRGDYTNAMSQVNAALAISPGNVRAKELLATYTRKEQERLETLHQREVERTEQEQLRREREQSEQQARQRTTELHEAFNFFSQPYENSDRFQSHEVLLSNIVVLAGSDIHSALSKEPPVFEIIRMEWVRPHLFKIEARQRVNPGYRDCLILGTQLNQDVVKVQFKVFEYEHAPDVKLLGGLVQVAANFKSASQDPSVVAATTEKFRSRVKEGIGLVRAKIHRP
jgi:tetratricopeptide (TPR) repeat protein